MFRALAEKMTEYCCFSDKQDEVIAKQPKKSPLVLKMVVLATAMTCSVGLCSVFLKQINEHSEPHIIRTNSTEKPQFHVVRPNLIDKNLPTLLRVNRTEKNLPEVRVNLTGKMSSLVVRANLTEVNLSKETLPLPMGVNLTEKPSHHSELSESQFRHFDYNKTKIYRRDENGCITVIPYAIVSKQRSGSRWFETLLNSHENIRSHGEIFHKVDGKYNMTVIKTLLDKVYSINWNEDSFRKKKQNCVAAVGFRWMLNQGIRDNNEGIVDYFNHRGVSVILLLRRNHLRHLVSIRANNHDGRARELNGTHKAHVQSKREAEILASYKPKLDVKHLIQTMENMDRLAAYTLQNFERTRYMVVYYEDLVENQDKIMKEVLEFLNVPQRTLISRDVKIHTRPLAQQIENWRAVANVIRRSKYRRFITANDYGI